MFILYAVLSCLMLSVMRNLVKNSFDLRFNIVHCCLDR
jgi:rRNA pseudouridine-1189 N-methylase Emg1 (Nep1/Mra1 family)